MTDQCECDCHKTGIQKIEQKLEVQQKEIHKIMGRIAVQDRLISDLWDQRNLGIERIKKLEEKLSIHQSGLERKWHANTELSNRLNELESKLSQQNPVLDLSQVNDLALCKHKIPIKLHCHQCYPKKTKTLWIAVNKHQNHDGSHYTGYLACIRKWDIVDKDMKVIKIELEIEE